jgi:hypothetical protein
VVFTQVGWITDLNEKITVLRDDEFAKLSTRVKAPFSKRAIDLRRVVDVSHIGL